MPGIIRTDTGDSDLDGNTIGLLARLVKLEAVSLLRGRLITGVSLPNATDVDIAHHLGRAWKGWLPVSKRGATAAGYINDSVAVDARTTLRLRATGYGATLTVSLWVF